MQNYLIIAENDESKWDDKTGEYYHFPSQYKNKLITGAKVIYYKGKKKKNGFERLSDNPHYFGIATIGLIERDSSANSKNSYYATIENYRPFSFAVDFKDKKGNYLENVLNINAHFRNGVRVISEEIYYKILSQAEILNNISDSEKEPLQTVNEDFSSYGIEGKKKVQYSTIYERDPQLRSAAIKIHGTICKCCGFDFEKSYGELGKGFIHVHHLKPISKSGELIVNPETDMIVLCPNCHSMIHRKKNNTLSIEELKAILLCQIKY